MGANVLFLCSVLFFFKFQAYQKTFDSLCSVPFFPYFVFFNLDFKRQLLHLGKSLQKIIIPL